MNVLIVKTSSLGDVIHTLPALTDAAQAISDISFDWLVEETFQDVPLLHPCVKQVIPVSIRKWRKNPWKYRAEIRNSIKQIRSKQYDLVIDAQGLIKSAILTRLAKGERYGLSWSSCREPLASLAYQHKINIPKGQHAIARVRQLFAESLGYELLSESPSYGLDKQKFPEPEQVKQPYLMFLHGTTWASKHWPNEYWKELISLATKQGFNVYLPWGNELEKYRASELSKAEDKAYVLPKSSIKELAHMLMHADGAVGVDSGLAHLAAACGTPAITLYGSTSAELTGTMGDNNQTLQADFRCSPCLNKECSYTGKSNVNPACYEKLQPNVVWNKLEIEINRHTSVDYIKQLEAWAVNSVQVLELVIDGERLTLQQPLRHLPSRRLTSSSVWKGKNVITKFFFGSKFDKYAAKEKNTLNSLTEAGINTPKLLHCYQGDGFTALVIEHIEDAVTLSGWMKAEPNDTVFESVIAKTTDLMLACHKRGFQIKDPHLDNFLLRDKNVYVIDAGGIRQSSNSLDGKQSIENLALLYAQLPVTLDIVAYQALENTVQRSDQSSLLSENDWQQLLLKQRRWRQKKFIDKKVFRECSAYICKSDNSRFLVAKRDFYSDEIAQALENPDALIEQGYLLKDGNTATVARVEIDGKTYVLKRYNIKKPIYSLVRGFKWSRAAVSWRNGLLLEMLGIPTAKSYALIEERWGALRRRSYLLSEYIDAPQAWNIFEGENFDEQERKVWAKKIYDLFLLLKHSQISHGDLKAQNILCPKKGPVLIDLDGMKSNQAAQDFIRQFEKNVQRFQCSWPTKWKENPYFRKYCILLFK